MIEDLERTLGTRLPEDYRAFLLANNARQIRPCVVPTPAITRAEKLALHDLSCFFPKQPCDFAYRINIYSGRIPKGFLPIASDPGSNLILLDLRPESFGKIHFWERAFEVDEGEEPTMQNV